MVGVGAQFVQRLVKRVRIIRGLRWRETLALDARLRPRDRCCPRCSHAGGQGAPTNADTITNTSKPRTPLLMHSTVTSRALRRQADADGALGFARIFVCDVWRAIAIFVLLAVSSAAADTIVLKNGRHIIASNVTETADRVSYETPAGTLSLPRSIVDRIVRDDRSPSGFGPFGSAAGQRAAPGCGRGLCGTCGPSGA